MIMGIPFFLLFAVYGVVNVYLPLLLSGLGYSATMIGILQGIFEASGLLFPILISARVDKRGSYGSVMVALGLLMVAVLPLLAISRSFIITALMLALFAIGYKGIVPVADALSSRMLGPDSSDYGKVRVMGSIGFVCITLLLQIVPLVDSSSPVSIALWIGIPSVAFTLSVLLVPGLLQRFPPDHEPDVISPSAPVTAVAGSTLSADAPANGPADSTGSFSAARSPHRGLRKLREFPSSFWGGIALIFLGFLGLTPSQRFFSLYVQEYLKLDSYAGLWALSAAAEVPFMFLSGYFIRKMGTQKILVLSLLAILTRNLVYAVFPNFAGAVAGQLFHSVCYGLFHPAAVVFACERAPKRLMAVALTLYSSVSVGVASVIGNILGGFVIDTLGYRPLFLVFCMFPFIGLVAFSIFRNIFAVRSIDTPFTGK
ncbi:MAG: MFS transporter [Treponema sp.]|nr:MAG: MFS transporter [Treponema sp.]